MAASNHAGFKPEYRQSGGSFTKQNITVADTAFREGDTVNLESGDADLGATGDTNFIGVVTTTKSGMTASTTEIEVITDPDLVMSVYDANARSIGDTLDLTGATGAQGVTTSSNKEFVVVADSTATERTLVRWNVGKHHYNKAQ